MRFILVAVLAASSLFAARADDAEPHDFSLPSLDGVEVSLSEYRGQWVVVNYWAIWCKPCVKEIPDLAALHSRREDVTVLGLAFDESGPAAIRTFLEDFDMDYPILMVDTFEPAEGVETPMVLPTTLLFDPSGKEQKRFLGAVTSAQIEAAIEEVQPSMSSES